MKKVILYIAASIDNKIADSDGGVDWLNQFSNSDNSDYGYAKFYTSIDTIIMGHSTYKKILSFGGEFPYRSHNCYVLTRDKSLISDDNVEFVLSEDIQNLINRLRKEKTKKDIWLMGGGELNSLFIENNWIDEIILFVMPIVLGEGIAMFPALNGFKKMKFKSSKTYSSGAIEIRYFPEK